MDGFWSSPPGGSDLRKARHARAQGPVLPGYDDVWKGWFHGDVPDDFQVVGRRAPSKTARAYVDNVGGTMVFGTAERLRAELHSSWRWKHDREAIAAEIDAAQARKRQRAEQRRAAMTLPKMLRERIFTSWRGRWPPRVVREARRIFHDATKALIALERGGTRRERVRVLKRISTEFNALYDQEGCIDTVEAEEIVARVEELARLVGVTNANERLTGHREW